MAEQMEIRTGFLAGNLGDGAEQYAEQYAGALEAAIMAAYPRAEVTVTFENGFGSLPSPLRTLVSGSEDDDGIEAHVDRIAAGVWESFAWVPESATASAGGGGEPQETRGGNMIATYDELVEELRLNIGEWRMIADGYRRGRRLTPWERERMEMGEELLRRAARHADPPRERAAEGE